MEDGVLTTAIKDMAIQNFSYDTAHCRIRWPSLKTDIGREDKNLYWELSLLWAGRITD